MSVDPESEKSFQAEVLSTIAARLDLRKQDGFRYSILEGFALDACVLVFSSGTIDFRFLEFKVYSGGRVGFGTSKGTGPQLNLLTLPDKFIERLTTNIRWCIKGPMAMGEKRYAIVDCASAKAPPWGRSRQASRITSMTSVCFYTPSRGSR